LRQRPDPEDSRGHEVGSAWALACAGRPFQERARAGSAPSCAGPGARPRAAAAQHVCGRSCARCDGSGSRARAAACRRSSAGIHPSSGC
jgi:hypothetical protein